MDSAENVAAQHYRGHRDETFSADMHPKRGVHTKHGVLSFHPLDPETSAMSELTDLNTSDAPETADRATPAAPRKRGRPLEMSVPEVLQRIRQLHESGALFRVHREQPALYARARRLFGTWGAALSEAGVDPVKAMNDARARSLETRRRARLQGRTREA